MSDDDMIKEMEAKLKELKLEQRIKQLEEAGHSDIPMTLTYDPNKFRLEKVKNTWMLVEIVEKVDPEKETILTKESIEALKEFIDSILKEKEEELKKDIYNTKEKAWPFQ